MILIERLTELLNGLRPGRKASDNRKSLPNEPEAPAAGNPWTHDLQRLECYSETEESPSEPVRSDSCENQIQLLMEQARLEKAKETLKRQQENLGRKSLEPRKPRTTDATIVDAKAWWGQSVATWNPEDSKNIGPQGEQRHPRQHKWFNH